MTTRQGTDSERLDRIEFLVERLVVTVDKIADDQAEMKFEIVRLSGEVGRLSQGYDRLSGEVERLSGEVGRLSEGYERLSGEVERLSGEVGRLSEGYERLSGEVERLSGGYERLSGEVERLSGGYERLSGEVERLSGGYERLSGEVGRLSEGYERQSRDLAKMSQDMAVIKGWQTELAMERRALGVFRQLSGGGHFLRIYPENELHHYAVEARHVGIITGQEFDQVESVDFLLEGTDRAGAAIMYAVEVSFSMGADDIDRVIDKAESLSRILRREVLSAVVGESAVAGFEDDARGRGVAYAYIGNGRRLMR